MKESDLTPQEEIVIQQEFEALLDDYRHTLHRQKIELITKAFHFAKQAHRGIRRRSGEPYILHPLAVARIVVKEIGLGSTSICAALLHDVVEDTEYTKEDIENLFGAKIADIVDGLTKISGGVFGEQASVQAENFRKLLLTMSEDIRVILIKIADRLHNMRTLEFQPVEKQYKIAGETQYIYAPLALRLGLFPIKTELENLSFKYEHPEVYADIEQKLQQINGEQMEFFETFAAPIREKLENMGYEFNISARIKSVYSIWKKMQTKNIPFEDVYDLLAVRIVFTPNTTMSEKDQCWMIYSALTEIYKPHPERIRDWISTPKANGYEALHVTVMGPNGQWVEVQIRTVRMHDIAEKGLAAHWKYKLGESDESELDKWLKTIKELLQHPEPNAIDFLDTFKLNLFASEIFVFTPKGEIKTLPQGSTALDFAFMLHTELGLHCMGAKVNHKLEALSYTLQGGDQVEVITSNTQHPQEEWLQYAITAKAQTAIKNYFRRLQAQEVQQGELLFRQALSKLALDNQYNTVLQQMMKHYHVQQPVQLMLQINKGIIDLSEMPKVLQQKSKSGWLRYFTKSDDEEVSSIEKKNDNLHDSETVKNKQHHIILTEENRDTEYQLSPCCNPIPGDDVLGYLDERGMIMIHKRNCPLADRLKSSYGNNLYSATWDMHHEQTFLETIEIRGIDKVGMIIEIVQIISNTFSLNIHDIHFTAEGGIFNGTLQLFVHDTEELQKVCNTLHKIQEIKSVQRIEH